MPAEPAEITLIPARTGLRPRHQRPHLVHVAPPPPPSWIVDACERIERHLAEQYQREASLRTGGFK